MDLSFSDVQNILRIIDEAPHLDEIDLVYGGFRLHVVRNGAGSSKPVTITAARDTSENDFPPPSIAATSTGAAATMAVPEGIVAIRAPMLGTFYRASAPGE